MDRAAPPVATPSVDHTVLNLRVVTPIPLSPVSWGNGVMKDICLVEMETMDGIRGLGSAYTSAARFRQAWEMLQPDVDGQPLDPEAVSAGLWQKYGDLIRADDDFLGPALSAIDIALWDILGKKLGRSVAELLGGRRFDRVLAYASLEIPLPERIPDQAFAARIERMKALGFRAIKLYLPGFGYRDAGRSTADWDQYEASVLAYARKVAGRGVLLMLDAWAAAPDWPNGAEWALKTAKVLARYGYEWFEEPLPPAERETYAWLRRNTEIAVTGCEGLTGVPAFTPWIRDHAVDIVQPDITRAGGLSVLRQIRAGARFYNGHVIPHGWNTAVGLAADLAFLASQVSDRRPLVEFMPSAHLLDPLLGQPFRLKDGTIRVPGGPGLGITLNRSLLQRGRGVFAVPEGGPHPTKP